MIRLSATAPLALVFASLLEGCLFTCGPRELAYGTSLTQEELDDALRADSDSFDTGLVPADPSTLSCEVVCDALFANGEAQVSDCVKHEVPDEGAVITVDCTILRQCVGGRLHEVITTTEGATGPDATAAWLAQMAHDEAAAVVAFRALVVELADHGAPDALIARVREAIADEVRHARQAHALAVARGGVVPRVEHGPARRRDLFSIALENTREACVVETWSALRTRFQAQHAADPALRAVFAQIADDETRHAELARDLDAWLRSQLSVADRNRLDRARAAAVASLLANIGGESEPSGLGLPNPAQATALLTGLREALWA